MKIKAPELRVIVSMREKINKQAEVINSLNTQSEDNNAKLEVYKELVMVSIFLLFYVEY